MVFSRGFDDVVIPSLQHGVVPLGAAGIDHDAVLVVRVDEIVQGVKRVREVRARFSAEPVQAAGVAVELVQKGQQGRLDLRGRDGSGVVVEVNPLHTYKNNNPPALLSTQTLWKSLSAITIFYAMKIPLCLLLPAALLVTGCSSGTGNSTSPSADLYPAKAFAESRVTTGSFTAGRFETMNHEFTEAMDSLFSADTAAFRVSTDSFFWNDSLVWRLDTVSVKISTDTAKRHAPFSASVL